MGKQAEYISKIEIKALWQGGRHIEWELRPDVNILSGINGVGKSTIINHSVVIRSFDRPLLRSDLLEKLADSRVRTELDWQIYKLQRRFLDYQVNIGNKIIEYLTSGDPEKMALATEIPKPKALFQDMMDRLFDDTKKKIDRKSNEIQFFQNGDTLTPYQLSSGEKQMLVILLTVLVEDGEPHALIMDEPEVSLHIEWQQQLISLIRQLNPKAQVIMSTHAPALIMDGWQDCVIEVEEITNPD